MLVPGRKLLNTELPTGQDKRSYSNEQLMEDMMSALSEQWLKASHLLKYPVLITERTIKIKLKDIWEKPLTFAKGRGKLKDKDMFNLKLDRLMDILYCNCPILMCSEFGCICQLWVPAGWEDPWYQAHVCQSSEIKVWKLEHSHDSRSRPTRIQKTG